MRQLQPTILFKLFVNFLNLGDLKVKSNLWFHHPNQHKSSHKVCDETKYPSLSFTEGQWKLRQELDQNFHLKEVIVEQILASEEINKYKRAGHLRQRNYNKHLPTLSVQ